MFNLFSSIDDFVHGMFPSAHETERFGGRIIYKIPKDDVGKLSEVFARFEEGNRINLLSESV